MINLNGVSAVTADSRKVIPGSVFFAIKGNTQNGEDFIEQAVTNGAAKVVVRYDYPTTTPAIESILHRVDNTRKALALTAAAFYKEQPDNLVAVTGTNGKTSVVNFYRQICEFNNIKAASIGTLGVTSEKANINLNLQGSLTSLDPVTLQQTLANLKQQEVNHVAIEASSHGLDQYRLDGAKIKASGFTNFTRDHLDYHPTMQDYFFAKSRLFLELTKECAVLNADIPEYHALEGICYRKKLIVWSYGQNGKAIKFHSLHNDILKITIQDKVYETLFHLDGKFQIHNTLCAIGLLLASGLKVEEILNAIPHLKAAAGRLELVGNKNNAKIFIDYAHTPDALESTLLSLREVCTGRLIVVFGCGGDRDPGKRPIMGEIAVKKADIVIVTDDNPRSEDPDKIREAIIKAAPNAMNIAGRDVAIKHAISLLQPHDMLVVAGKGHEDYQIIGEKKLHFSDKEEILKAL